MSKTSLLRLSPLTATALLSSIITTSVQAQEEVNVYSYRQPFLINPIFNDFTKQTGIKVNVVFSKKGLAERLKREGKNSPADLVLTSDFARLQKIVNSGVTQGVKDAVLEKNIPQQYRAADGKWFALTTRARVIYASKDRVKPADIPNYENLADPKWKGKLCTRSGKHPYNIALFASLIAHHGEAWTENWLTQVKGNLARKPQGNDRSQVKAIKEGICDLSLGNSYYYGKMLENPKQKPWADAVNIVFPNQGNRGTHVNISGIAMTQSAPHKANALKLMQFLSEPHAQNLYAKGNFEYPVNPSAKPSKLVASWGTFKADTLPLEKVAAYAATATRLVDKVRYDD